MHQAKAGRCEKLDRALMFGVGYTARKATVPAVFAQYTQHRNIPRIMQRIFDKPLIAAHTLKSRNVF
jgi:hypothetical protein